MPKLTQSVPKYRKHRASGQAITTIGGKDYYLGPHGTVASRHEYDRLIAEFLANGRRPLHIAELTQTISVAEVLAAFWKHAKVYYRKRGEMTEEAESYRRIIRLVNRLYGEHDATSFGPLAFKAIRQVWIESDHARSNINKNAGRLKRIFKWAVSEELVGPDIYQALDAVEGLKKGRTECREADPVLPVEIERVEATMVHLTSVVQDMIRFQLLTGARPGEVCTITPGDIDRSTDVWEYFVDGHKTEHHGRVRIVMIGPQAQEILRPYLDRAEDRVCFSMSESLEERRRRQAAARTTPLSCGNRRGKRSNVDRSGGRSSHRRPQEAFNTKSYNRTIRYACNLAFPAPAPFGKQGGESDVARKRRLSTRQLEELKRWQREQSWHPNQLRHSRATFIRKHYGLEAAQVILGHAKATVTEVYAERDLEKAREVMREAG